jgi:hypothetical protein
LSWIIGSENREQFSGPQTVWRRTQSAANPSLEGKIPVNREKYREFWAINGPDLGYSHVNTGVNGLWLEIVTGNEQGNNRGDNREFVLGTGTQMIS